MTSLLDELHTLVEKTWSSSEQAFKGNEYIAPQVYGVSQVSSSKETCYLCG
ncbi:MAG: hypothetical protein ABSB40_03610 [Nitrososphaeria archaeon]